VSRRARTQMAHKERVLVLAKAAAPARLPRPTLDAVLRLADLQRAAAAAGAPPLHLLETDAVRPAPCLESRAAAGAGERAAHSGGARGGGRRRRRRRRAARRSSSTPSRESRRVRRESN
jgi:hypothetical protein